MQFFFIFIRELLSYFQIVYLLIGQYIHFNQNSKVVERYVMKRLLLILVSKFTFYRGNVSSFLFVHPEIILYVSKQIYNYFSPVLHKW